MGSDKNSGTLDKSTDATITEIIEYKARCSRHAGYNINFARKWSKIWNSGQRSRHWNGSMESPMLGIQYPTTWYNQKQQIKSSLCIFATGGEFLQIREPTWDSL